MYSFDFTIKVRLRQSGWHGYQWCVRKRFLPLFPQKERVPVGPFPRSSTSINIFGGHPHEVKAGPAVGLGVEREKPATLDLKLFLSRNCRFFNWDNMLELLSSPHTRRFCVDQQKIFTYKLAYSVQDQCLLGNAWNCQTLQVEY